MDAVDKGKKYIEMKKKEFENETLDQLLSEDNAENNIAINNAPKRFNKERWLGNLKFLMDKEKVKIGTIEEAVGVSLGYLARIKRGENATNPSIEFVAESAKILNTSIDDIIDKDLSIMSPTDQYLYEFIKKMINDTKNNKLYWDKEAKTELSKSVGKNENGVTHPLFRPKWMQADDGDYYVFPQYYSQFYPDYDWIVWDCFYKAKITGGTVYITNIHEYENVTFSNELNLVSSYGVVNKLSHYVFEKDNPLGNITNELYKTAEESSNHARLSVDVLDAIDAFMGDTEKENRILDFEYAKDRKNNEATTKVNATTVSGKHIKSDEDDPDNLPLY